MLLRCTAGNLHSGAHFQLLLRGRDVESSTSQTSVALSGRSGRGACSSRNVSVAWRSRERRRCTLQHALFTADTFRSQGTVHGDTLWKIVFGHTTMTHKTLKSHPYHP